MKNHHSGIEPTPIGRRTILQRTGFGLGAFALAEMLQGEQASAASVDPLAPRIAAFCGEGQERDLPAHGGCSQSLGPV